MSNDTGNWIMGGYPDYLANFPSMSAEPPPTSQSNSIEESPEGSDVSESTIPTDLGGILGPPQSSSFQFALPSSGIDIQRSYSDGYNWQFSQPQALSAFSGQGWNSVAITNPGNSESGLREVYLNLAD